jgi:preprotein translocase subunit SecB
MNEKTLVDDPKAVDVSGSEGHYEVQCTDVRLLSSQLRPIKLKEDDERLSRFRFKIDGGVEGNSAYSSLNVQVVSVHELPETGFDAYEIKFKLIGIFKSEYPIKAEILADFIRMYTLSILWPYAREYTSDQLRRAGQTFEALPIINPQFVTEKLIEGGLVKIKINS